MACWWRCKKRLNLSGANWSWSSAIWRSGRPSDHNEHNEHNELGALKLELGFCSSAVGQHRTGHQQAT
jgi:hypothetical protein